jgi:hypothetical protein
MFSKNKDKMNTFLEKCSLPIPIKEETEVRHSTIAIKESESTTKIIHTKKTPYLR